MIQIDIPMPEGMTNGDVFKVMFPNTKVTSLTNGTVALEFRDHNFVVVNTDWWNAPFKSESEGEDVEESNINH